MHLLIDNSNTRTKFCLADSQGLLDISAWLPTANLDPSSITSLTAAWSFKDVVLCSVVPHAAMLLQQTLGARAEVHLLDCESPLGLRLDYPQPHHIGADRLANAVAVAHLGRVPAIVIDFGTAVTFDVISDEPAYCGGVIAPGLGAMNDYLHRRTALLPMIELHEPEHAIGKSTTEAMLAGAVYGYRGLVKEIVLQLQKELPRCAAIIATGGDAALIARGMPEIDEVDPLITLRGLHHIACRVFD